MIKKTHIVFMFCIYFLSMFCPLRAEDSLWSGSIMFSITDNRRVHELLNSKKAVKEKKQNTDEKDIEKLMETISIKSEDLAKLPKEAPAFHLNSILYVAQDDWIIWINGKKISINDKDSFVKVKKVTKNHAVLYWESEYFIYINKKWDSASGDNIEIDKKNHRVYFTLYPNQTFVTKTMEVVEGKKAGTPLFYEKANLPPTNS